MLDGFHSSSLCMTSRIRENKKILYVWDIKSIAKTFQIILLASNMCKNYTQTIHTLCMYMYINILKFVCINCSSGTSWCILLQSEGWSLLSKYLLVSSYHLPLFSQILQNSLVHHQQTCRPTLEIHILCTLQAQ